MLTDGSTRPFLYADTQQARLVIGSAALRRSSVPRNQASCPTRPCPSVVDQHGRFARSSSAPLRPTNALGCASARPSRSMHLTFRLCLVTRVCRARHLRRHTARKRSLVVLTDGFVFCFSTSNSRTAMTHVLSSTARPYRLHRY